MNHGHPNQSSLIFDQSASIQWILIFDILMRINTILLTHKTGKGNYAILSQLSIILEILDIIEYHRTVYDKYRKHEILARNSYGGNWQNASSMELS